MLILYDKDHNKIAGLTNYKEYNLEREINSEDTLSFQYPSNDLDNRLLEQECYIRTKENEYIIKEVNYEDDDWVSYVCKINIEDIKGQNVDHFEVDSENCTDAVNLALSGTGWTVGACDVSRIRPVSKSKCTAYDVLQEIQSSYDCEISYDSINKKAYIYNEMGNDRGAYFAEQLNLKSLEVQGNSYDYVTMLVPIGKDGLDITSVNNGKNYVENYQYSSKKLIGYWEDNRYTDPSALMEDAAIQLEYLSKPLKSYKVDLVDLAKAIDAENYDTYKLIDYSLGDAVTILSKEKNVKEKQRIVKMTIYPDEPERNEVELSNKSPSLEYLQIKFEDTSDTVDSITTSDGMIDGSKVDSIDWDKIDHIHVKIADVENLSATIANIGTLTATKANITDLDTTNASIQNLQSNKANVEDLTASNARISTLEVGAESVNTLLAGNLSASNMQAGFITANSGLIADGAIANAQIINLDVSKLNAGNISTNKFVVQSDSGNLQIKGNVLKVWDTSGKERVSLGLNDNDYNLLIRGNDGNTVLFGTDGVTKAGITLGAVDDSKIDINANIQGTKLDINSVFSSMNGSSSSLKATKVNLDDQEQTLQVAFTNLSNTVSNQGTSLSIVQGQINSKVWQQDITTVVNNIQIGGRNLALETNVAQYGLGMFISNGSLTTLDTNTTFLGEPTIKIDMSSSTAGIMYNGWITLKRNTTYTYSMMMYSSTAYTFTNMFPLHRWLSTSQTAAHLEIITAYTTSILANTWTKVYLTFSTPDTADAYYLRPFIYQGFSLGSIINVCNIKVEEGNKATDWTPAPEDVQGQITTINSNYSSLNQTVNSISSTVGSLQTTTSNLGTRVSSTESSISQLNNAITTKVTQSDINNSINAMQVGGRNLLPDTLFTLGQWLITNNGNAGTGAYNCSSSDFRFDSNAQSIHAWGTGNGNGIPYLCARIGLDNTKLLLQGKTLTFSCSPPFLNNCKITALLIGWDSNWNVTLYHIFNIGETYSVPSGINISNLAVEISTIANSSSAGYTFEGDIYHPKLEFGNKVTDWTPAPEDFQNQINTQNSTITQLSNQINLRVTTDTYNSGMSTANSNAQSYANTAKNNAISSANSHTDSQISILQGQINSKVDVNGVQSTITQSPSQVQVAFNNINSSIVKIDKMGLTVANGYFNIVQDTDTIFTFAEDGLKNTGVEMGSVVRANIPYIDFHSSGFDNDYDSRISGDGGNSYTGKGNISVDADAFWLNVNKANYHGREIIGGNYETYAIGIVQGSTNYLEIYNNSGAWGASIWASDISLKNNIQDSLEDALPVINNIKHRMFNWKQDGRLQKLGYVAQELNEINSDFVMKIPQENGYVRMQPNETTIIPYLSKAIQELSKEINDLKEEMEKLKGNSLIGQ
jgi:phage minor structural protein